MQKDHDLLESLQEPILHFYEWKNPSITCGYFIKPEKYFSLEALQKEGIDLAKRPTGGGCVFHLWDLAFSLLIPHDHKLCYSKPLLNYAWVNEMVLNACMELFFKEMALQKEDHQNNDLLKDFCMAHPTHYDVVYGQKKIAGAAQRKTKKGFLHQGTVFIQRPNLNLLKKTLVIPEPEIMALYNESFYLTENVCEYREWKKKLKEFLIKHLQKSDI